MTKMVKVTAEQPHKNDYGAKREKKKGDSYDAPEAVAKSLAKQGLVKLPGKADDAARGSN